jgi:hypothetical protein
MRAPETTKVQPPTQGPKTKMGTVKSVASTPGGAMGSGKK